MLILFLTPITTGAMRIEKSSIFHFSFPFFGFVNTQFCQRYLLRNTRIPHRLPQFLEYNLYTTKNTIFYDMVFKSIIKNRSCLYHNGKFINMVNILKTVFENHLGIFQNKDGFRKTRLKCLLFLINIIYHFLFLSLSRRVHATLSLILAFVVASAASSQLCGREPKSLPSRQTLHPSPNNLSPSLSPKSSKSTTHLLKTLATRPRSRPKMKP